MRPLDIPATAQTLPPGARDRAVIITGGTDITHQHMVRVIQHEHPGLVVAWYAYSPATPALVDRGSLIGRIVRAGRNHGLRTVVRDYASPMIWMRRFGLRREHAARSDLLDYLGDRPVSAAAIFEPELDRLHVAEPLEPILVDSPNSADVVSAIKELDPYFLLIFGGPLLDADVLGSVRGLALNPHAGWSPQLRGSFTTEQALYHRRLDWVGSTIHIATTAADAGPILRRSTVTLYDDDTPADCFFRVVALGNWLLADVVRDLMSGDDAIVFSQTGPGTTLRASDFDAVRRGALADDFRRGWLGEALEASRRY